MVHLSGYTARPSHPRAKRAAQGAENLIAWKTWPDARPAVTWLGEHGFTLVGLETSAGALDFREYEYSWPLCIVVGNEALGIAPGVEKRIDGIVRIPMHGGKSSLNVVVALGILLYHIIDEPGRPSLVTDAEKQPGSASALSSIVRRAVTAPRVNNVWYGYGTQSPGSPALVLVAEAPSFPPCEVWGLPRLGGVLLRIEQHPGAEDACSSNAVVLKSGTAMGGVGQRRRVSLATLPRTERASAYRAEMGLWRAFRAQPALQRMALDAHVLSLVEQYGGSRRLAPYMTRYVGTADLGERKSMAKLVLREALRPLGGLWREGEFLVVPAKTALNDAADGFIRHVLFGHSRLW